MIFVMIIVLNCSLLFAGPKPPTSAGGPVAGGAGTGGPMGGTAGGGAPIDGGFSILLLLGASYAGKTVYKLRKDTVKSN